jgi:hypothetical protein
MEAIEALAWVSDRVEKEILLRNEYLAAENEILKSKITSYESNNPVILTQTGYVV